MSLGAVDAAIAATAATDARLRKPRHAICAGQPVAPLEGLSVAPPLLTFGADDDDGRSPIDGTQLRLPVAINQIRAQIIFDYCDVMTFVRRLMSAPTIDKNRRRLAPERTRLSRGRREVRRTTTTSIWWPRDADCSPFEVAATTTTTTAAAEAAQMKGICPL